jgi:O-acetyl-ADP-ribose deacetylase (regulator of RNase III)
VHGALAQADQAGSSTVAMPVFGAGHASFPFEGAALAIAEALASASTAVHRVVLVILDPDRVPIVQRVLDRVIPRSGPIRP